MYTPHAFNVSVASVEKKLWFVVLYRASDISRKKKAKFRGIFGGKFAEKSQNSRKNRPI